MSAIQDNIANVQARIQRAAQRAQRDPDSVLLVAVSKTKAAADINAAAACGLTDFAENYLQEALEKITASAALKLHWHFIGPVQSNKTKLIAQSFNWVHSVDRIKIAQRLSEQRPPQLGPLNICLQVNIDREASKSGLMPEQLTEVAGTIAQLPNLKLRGLMAIPERRHQLEDQRQPFRQLQLLKAQINSQLDNCQKLDTLSMGMSADLEAAVQEGATMVRIGTDIFGARDATSNPRVE